VVWTIFPMNLVVIELHNFGVFGSTPWLLWLVHLVYCNFLMKNKAKCKCPLQLENSIIRLVAKGENKLWMGQDCYHIVLFFKGAHVCTSTMSLLNWFLITCRPQLCFDYIIIFISKTSTWTGWHLKWVDMSTTLVSLWHWPLMGVDSQNIFKNKI
jgi:hypothetical protein